LTKKNFLQSATSLPALFIASFAGAVARGNACGRQFFGNVVEPAPELL
jgi:hypothetical protein